MKDFDLKLKLPPIPSEDALHIAARCWQDDETRDIEMDSRLATAFARRLDLLWLSTARERMLSDEEIEIVEFYGDDLEKNYSVGKQK